MTSKANTPLIPQRQKRDYVVDGEKKPSVNPTKKDATESLPTAEKIEVPQKVQPVIAASIQYESGDLNTKNKRKVVPENDAKPQISQAETKAKDKGGTYSSAMKQAENAQKAQEKKEVDFTPIVIDKPPVPKKPRENKYGQLNALNLNNSGEKDANSMRNRGNAIDIPDEETLKKMSMEESASVKPKEDKNKEQWSGNTCTIVDGTKTTIKEYLDDAHTKLKKETIKSGNQTTVTEYNEKTGKPSQKTKVVSNNDMIVREQRDTYADDGVTVSSTLMFGPGGKKTQLINYKCGPNHNETHTIDYDSQDRESQKTVTDSATDKQLSVTTYKYAADGSRTESTKTLDA